MENEELERLLRDSAFCGSILSGNKESLKNILMNLKRPYQRKRNIRVWKFASAFSVCLFIAAAFFLVVEDNNQPGPANNLGGIWSTYSDSADGGKSIVWPPVSTSCQNLFVKSAPGYGGKGYAVRITGKTGGTADAFLGVYTYLSQRASCPQCIGIDIRPYKGIRFKMKGKAGSGKLFFILPHESRTPSPDRNSCMTLTGYNDYQTDITGLIKDDWTDVKLVFRKDFSQPSSTLPDQKVDVETVLEDQNLIKWKWAGGNDQDIDLWIDEIELY